MENGLRISESNIKLSINYLVSCMVSSSNGRLFCGDKAGGVWEMDFRAKASPWRKKKVFKVESQSWGDILMPDFIKASKSVKCIAIDETRHNLFALIEQYNNAHTIENTYINDYNLGMFGTSYLYLFNIKSESILSSQTCKYQLKNKADIKNMNIISINSIERTESDIISVMVMLTTGIRVYL